MGGARHLPHSVLAVLLLTLTLAPAAHAQLYRWTDEKGETHFGQGMESVPERYRSRASAAGRVDPPPAPSGPAAATVTDGVTRIGFAPGFPIMVMAKINGRGPVQLVLDTGATRTAIRPAALIGLGVTYRDAPKVQIRGVTGSASAYLVILESVEVGGARVDLCVCSRTTPSWTAARRVSSGGTSWTTSASPSTTPAASSNSRRSRPPRLSRLTCDRGVLGQFASPYLLSPRLAARPLSSNVHVLGRQRRSTYTHVRLASLAPSGLVWLAA